MPMFKMTTEPQEQNRLQINNSQGKFRDTGF